MSEQKWNTLAKEHQSQLEDHDKALVDNQELFGLEQQKLEEQQEGLQGQLLELKKNQEDQDYRSTFFTPICLGRNFLRQIYIRQNLFTPNNP